MKLIMEIIDNNGNAKRQANDSHEQSYQEGLEDAWQCAKKIVDVTEGYSHNEINEIYGSRIRAFELSALEAINKMKEHEMKQFAEKQKQASDGVKIKVGDEVVFPDFHKGIVIHVHTTKFGNTICYGRFDDGKYGEFLSASVQLTGKHFDNLDEALKEVGG